MKLPPSYPTLKPNIITPPNYIYRKKNNLFNDILVGKKYQQQIFKGKEDIAIAEGFISQSLGRKPITIKEKDIYKAVKKYSSPFATRRAFIIK